MICFSKQSSKLHYFSFFTVAPSIEFGPEHFEGLTVKAGESIRAKALIQGRPVPQVVWFKDGKEIEKKLGVEINTAIGYSTIFVRDATRDHRGVYSVEAKNSSGTKKEDMTIRVHGKMKIHSLQDEHVIYHILYKDACYQL